MSLWHCPTHGLVGPMACCPAIASRATLGPPYADPISAVKELSQAGSSPMDDRQKEPTQDEWVRNPPYPVWLIERKSFVGGEHAEWLKSSLGEREWTTEAHTALWFEAEREAHQMIMGAHLKPEVMCYPTDHIFLSRPSAPSRAVPDEEPTLDESAVGHVIARLEAEAARSRAQVERYGETRKTDLQLCRAPRLAELDAEIASLRALMTELSALRSESEAVKAERDTAIEAMLKTIHESSSDYEAALESARSESEAQLDDWRNREAACCPEDVGFEEYIGTLKRQLAASQAESEALRRDKAELTLDKEALEKASNRLVEHLTAVMGDLVAEIIGHRSAGNVVLGVLKDGGPIPTNEELAARAAELGQAITPTSILAPLIEKHTR